MTKDIAGVRVGTDTMGQVPVIQTLGGWPAEVQRGSRWQSCVPETQYRNVLFKRGRKSDDQRAVWGKPVVCGIWENKRTPQCKLQKKCCPQKRRMVTTIV